MKHMVFQRLEDDKRKREEEAALNREALVKAALGLVRDLLKDTHGDYAQRLLRELFAREVWRWNGDTEMDNRNVHKRQAYVDDKMITTLYNEVMENEAVEDTMRDIYNDDPENESCVWEFASLVATSLGGRLERRLFVMKELGAVRDALEARSGGVVATRPPWKLVPHNEITATKVEEKVCALYDGYNEEKVRKFVESIVESIKNRVSWSDALTSAGVATNPEETVEEAAARRRAKEIAVAEMEVRARRAALREKNAERLAERMENDSHRAFLKTCARDRQSRPPERLTVKAFQKASAHPQSKRI
jgi:hypothetical protein